MAIILVIDDDETLQQGLFWALRHKGLVPLPAFGGGDALEVLAKLRPDLIVLDLRLADMDGLDLLTHLRTEPRLAGTPVVVYSAVVDDAVRRRAAELGVADVVDKNRVEWSVLAGQVVARLADPLLLTLPPSDT